jgi:hypothetical protein
MNGRAGDNVLHNRYATHTLPRKRGLKWSPRLRGFWLDDGGLLPFHFLPHFGGNQVVGGQPHLGEQQRCCWRLLYFHLWWVALYNNLEIMGILWFTWSIPSPSIIGLKPSPFLPLFAICKRATFLSNPEHLACRHLQQLIGHFKNTKSIIKMKKGAIYLYRIGIKGLIMEKWMTK